MTTKHRLRLALTALLITAPVVGAALQAVPAQAATPFEVCPPTRWRRTRT